MEDKDPVWNSLHCTCGASGVAVMAHEPHCAVFLIESLQTQLEAAELKAKEWIDIAYEAASQKEELKRELERVERETIERCAKVCEGLLTGHGKRLGGSDTADSARRVCIAAIRDLARGR